MNSVRLMLPTGDIPATLCGPGLSRPEQAAGASSSATANTRTHTVATVIFMGAMLLRESPANRSPAGPQPG